MEDTTIINGRYGFKVVVESVSPESPAYATDAVHAGCVTTHKRRSSSRLKL